MISLFISLLSGIKKIKGVRLKAAPFHSFKLPTLKTIIIPTIKAINNITFRLYLIDIVTGLF